LNIKYFLDAVLVSQVYLLICHIVVNLFYITDLWAECGNDSSLPLADVFSDPGYQV